MGQTVEITISTATAGAHIIYTIDATTPGESNGSRLDSGGKFALPAGVTMIKAIAVGEGLSGSDIAVAAYEWDTDTDKTNSGVSPASPPRPEEKKAGPGPSATKPKSETRGRSGMPTSSPRTTGAGRVVPPRIPGGAPRNAPASPRLNPPGDGPFNPGAKVVTRQPQETEPRREAADKPVITPAGGNFAKDVRVTVRFTCQTPGASIIYTTNGSAPALGNGKRIASGQSITLPKDAKTTIKAIAVKIGMSSSPAASATFTRSDSGKKLQGSTLDRSSLPPALRRKTQKGIPGSRKLGK